MEDTLQLDFNNKDLNAYSITIYQKNIDKTAFDDSKLPTDIHLIEYKVNNELYCDSVRAYKKVDIFDVYWDALSKLEDSTFKVISITNGYGRIKPKLFSGQPQE